MVTTTLPAKYAEHVPHPKGFWGLAPAVLLTSLGSWSMPQMVRFRKVTGHNMGMQSWVRVAKNGIIDPVSPGHFHKGIPNGCHIAQIRRATGMVQVIQRRYNRVRQ